MCMFTATCACLAFVFSLVSFALRLLGFAFRHCARALAFLGFLSGKLSSLFSFVVVRLGCLEIQALILGAAFWCTPKGCTRWGR